MTNVSSTSHSPCARGETRAQRSTEADGRAAILDRAPHPTIRSMIASDDPRDTLAAHGLRITRQRVALVELLRCSTDHPTAIDLHRQILRRFPRSSRKTAYEALSSLVEAGLASCLTGGGEPFRYEANADSQYHGRCRSCGRIYDLPAKADGPIRGLTPVPEGFRVESVHVTLPGRVPPRPRMAPQRPLRSRGARLRASRPPTSRNRSEATGYDGPTGSSGRATAEPTCRSRPSTEGRSCPPRAPRPARSPRARCRAPEPCVPPNAPRPRERRPWRSRVSPSAPCVRRADRASPPPRSCPKPGPARGTGR